MVNGMMNQDRFLNFEEQLQSILYPVNPDQRFVKDLNNRLSTPKRVFLADQTARFSILSVGLGLFVGIFLVWMIQKNVKS